MVGSYLSVITGFVVQAGAPLLLAAGLPTTWLWLTWVVPSLVGVPLWALWRAQLRQRVRAPRQPLAAAQRTQAP